MNEQDCEQLTLFPEDFPASHFPWLESKKVKKMIVTSGLKCSGLSENLSHVGYLVRTYLESCELPAGTWQRVWSVKDLTSSCLILKLRLSELRTDGSASSLLGTITAHPDNVRSKEFRKERALTAGEYVKMFPTPQSHEVGDYQYSRGDHSKPTLTLTGLAKLWPTPRASDYKGCGALGSPSAEHFLKKGYLCGTVLYSTPNARDWKNARAQEWDNPKNTRNLNRQIAKLCEGGESTEERNGQLNPTWVEWLMGFPIGWTELNASETQ